MEQKDLKSVKLKKNENLNENVLVTLIKNFKKIKDQKKYSIRLILSLTSGIVGQLFYAKFLQNPNGSIFSDEKKQEKQTKQMSKGNNNNEKQQLNILAIHGYQQSSDIFQKRLAPLIKGFNKFYNTTVIVPQGPHVPEEGSDEKNPVYCWLNTQGEWKEQFKKESTSFIGFQQSLEVIVNTLKQNPNINCLIGFSQGAMILTFILAYLKSTNELESLLKNVKAVMLFSGVGSPFPNNLTFVNEFLNFKDSLNLNVLHCIADNDKYIERFRSEKLICYYNQMQSEIYIHNNGHCVPSKEINIQSYKAFLNRFI